MLHRHLA